MCDTNRLVGLVMYSTVHVSQSNPIINSGFWFKIVHCAGILEQSMGARHWVFRKRVVVPARQAGGIDSLESIPGLLKRLQIRAWNFLGFSTTIHKSGEHNWHIYDVFLFFSFTLRCSARATSRARWTPVWGTPGDRSSFTTTDGTCLHCNENHIYVFPEKE